MPVKRVNITLDPTLHDQAQEYCEKKGITFSALVTDLIRDKISLTETKPTVQMLMENGTVQEVMVSFFRSNEGRDILRALLRDLPHPDQVIDPTPKKEEAKETRTISPGSGPRKVPVDQEFLARLRKFTNAEISKACGISDSTLRPVISGSQLSMQRKTYDALIQALDTLEGGQ